MISCTSQLLRLVSKKVITRPFMVLFSSTTSSSSSSVSSNNPSQLKIERDQQNNDNEYKTSRFYSNSANVTHEPMEDFFRQTKRGTSIGQQNLVGKTASINRVFGPAANAQALLTCGGKELAQHASFDPNYDRAKGWIRSRPVGSAVLSSTLISGLVGALIEASFPQTVPVNSSMNFLRPLIVGMEVCARIKIESVNETQRNNANNDNYKKMSTEETGYEIFLSTQVIRVQDDIIISEGHHTVWIPSYL
mmetsp:Transcript_2904/g.3327  ORF Transcript_2904/g.3327 Transcript_2904/m.3327 type:complete len:249 (+) Transcript_2904:99-845(+)